MRAVVAGVDLTAMGRRVAERAGMIADSGGGRLRLIQAPYTSIWTLVPGGFGHGERLGVDRQVGCPRAARFFVP